VQNSTGSSPSSPPAIPERPRAAHSRGSAATESPRARGPRRSPGPRRSAQRPRYALRRERHVVARRRCRLVVFGRDEAALAPVVGLPQHAHEARAKAAEGLQQHRLACSARPPAARARSRPSPPAATWPAASAPIGRRPRYRARAARARARWPPPPCCQTRRRRRVRRRPAVRRLHRSSRSLHKSTCALCRPPAP